MNGKQHFARSHQAVQRQQPQTGRAIDDHVIKGCAGGALLLHIGIDGLAQPELSALAGHQFDLGTCQVDRCGGSQEAGDFSTFCDNLGQRGRIAEDVVHIGGSLAVLDAQSGGGVALGIKVDHHHALTHHCQSCSDVDGGGGLAHPTLLVGNREDPGHRLTPTAPAGQPSPLGRPGSRPPDVSRETSAGQPRPLGSGLGSGCLVGSVTGVIVP